MPFYSHSKLRTLHGGLNVEIPLAFWQRRFPCFSTAAHKSLARSVQAVFWTIPSRKLPGDTDAWWQSTLEIRVSMDVDKMVHTLYVEPGGVKSSVSQSEGANEQARWTHYSKSLLKRWGAASRICGREQSWAALCTGLFCRGDVLYWGIEQILLDTEQYQALPGLLRLILKFRSGVIGQRVS